MDLAVSLENLDGAEYDDAKVQFISKIRANKYKSETIKRLLLKFSNSANEGVEDYATHALAELAYLK